MATTDSAMKTIVLVVCTICVAVAVAKAPVWRNVVEDDRAANRGPSAAVRVARTVEVVAKEVERYKQGHGSGLGGAVSPGAVASSTSWGDAVDRWVPGARAIRMLF
jgi:hypothetical protein